jgi:hypothetical protein
MKIEGSAFGSGSISQRHGSADPDPDPPKMSWIRNTAILDPHLFYLYLTDGPDPDPHPDLDLN